MSSCMTNRNRCMGGNDIEASRSPGSSRDIPPVPFPLFGISMVYPLVSFFWFLGSPLVPQRHLPCALPSPICNSFGRDAPKKLTRMPKQLNGTLTMNSVVKTHICSKDLYPK